MPSLISVCIVAKNAAGLLPQCISGLSKITSDIVVVVDQSTADTTAQVAKDLGARVFFRQFDNFASQKNFAASKAKHEWVFFLDADEAVSPALQTEIVQLEVGDYGAFSIPRLNYIFGKPILHTNWGPKDDTHIWLYHKNNASWQGKVHEEVTTSGKVGVLINPKLHWPYKDVSDFISKLNLYTSLETVSINPFVDFFRRYVWHLGFLDGWHGFFLSYLMFFYHTVTWIKIWQKNPRIGLILVILLAFSLRLIKLDQSFWLDEAAQAVMSGRSVVSIWLSRTGDFHPPLFYLLAHYWITFGREEAFLRLLPVSFGVLNVWLVYFFAQAILPTRKHSGVLAGFLLAINPYHIYYSQEFRSYSLLCLLGTASMYLFYKRKNLALFIVNTLLLYTHYASLFLIASQFLYWLLSIRKAYPNYLFSLFLSLLAYTPWMPQLYFQLNSGLNISQNFPGWSQMLSVAPLKILPMTIFKLTAGRISFLNRYLYGVYIVSVLAVFFSGVLLAAYRRRFLYTWAFLPVLVMLLVSLFLPQNQPFRVIYVLPAFILLFTQTCYRFPKLFITFLIYISLVGNISYFTRPRLQREQWRQAIQYVDSKNTPAILAFPGKLAPFTWYKPELPVYPAFTSLPADYKTTFTNVSPAFNSPSLLVFDYLSAVTDTNHVLDKVLVDSGYRLTKTHNFEGVGFINEYRKHD